VSAVLASPAAKESATGLASVPCNMRCTGRPRPIPGEDSTRCGTRSFAGMSLSGRGRTCAATAAQRVSTPITITDVQAYGVSRLLDEVTAALREGRWRPLPARRVFIRKARFVGAKAALDSFCRGPGCAGCGEDRARAVFEADMLACSFGFRPRRATHDALQVVVDESWRGRRWVVETDIANCFEAIPHQGLMRAVQERVSDQSVLKLLRLMLRAGVMSDGQVRRSVTGTPQGGLCSAAHNPPNEQRWLMRSVDLSGLMSGGSRVERCA